MTDIFCQENERMKSLITRSLNQTNKINIVKMIILIDEQKIWRSQFLFFSTFYCNFPVALNLNVVFNCFIPTINIRNKKI